MQEDADTIMQPFQIPIQACNQHYKNIIYSHNIKIKNSILIQIPHTADSIAVYDTTHLLSCVTAKTKQSYCQNARHF